jgi:N-acetylglucosaminyldiphosphoundecaprenol N-acetyl-beta-D-mannosaminyltransferase
MQKYFNVSLEFNHSRLSEIIENTISNNGKGYVCIVDANVLTIAQKNENYCSVLNQSIVNSCDGSSIAMLAGFAHKRKFRAWNGPDIFTFYIEKKYKQLLLGSTEETSNEIKDILKNKGIDNSHISVLTLPFKSVYDFDYIEISKIINELNPDIIWVSLGAPKQELFMNKLLPYLSRGVMFGIGAAFNFYIGKIALPNARVGALKFIWISRIFKEPNKQLSRILPYLLMIPKLYLSEKNKK